MATKTTRESAEQTFNHFKNDNSEPMKGFEGIGATEQAIPFLKLAQPLSPQLSKNKPEFIPGLEEGFFFNSVTKKSYGDSLIVVCGGFEHIYIEWPPVRGKGGPIAYHTPAEASKIAADTSFGNWKTKAGNRLDETYLYYMIVEGEESSGVIVLSLSSTNIPPAKQFNRRLVSTTLPNGAKAKPFWMKWKLSSVEASNDKGSWHKVSFDLAGYVSESLLLLVNKERESLPEPTKLDYKQLESGAEKTDY